jgi:hypothetical protein
VGLVQLSVERLLQQARNPSVRPSSDVSKNGPSAVATSKITENDTLAFTWSPKVNPDVSLMAILSLVVVVSRPH